MCSSPRRWRTIIATLLLIIFANPVFADQGYEAPLPPQLSSDPDMCAYAPCTDVMPKARRFSLRKGHPAYVEAYRGEPRRLQDHREQSERDVDARHAGRDDDLLGYVFLSTDMMDIPGYSGKPIVTLIGMDTAGIITGVKVLRHSEPILLLGIPESQLDAFIRQYVGKSVGRKIEVGRSRADVLGVDAITGATVTVIAEHQVILGSARAVAKQVGIIEPDVRPAVEFTSVAKLPADRPDWADLIKQGSVRRLMVRPQEVGQPPSRQRYIDMYFGYLNAPAIGISVLGDSGYRRLMADLGPNEHAIFVVADGMESFKGSGFVRGGIFDRIQVIQGSDSFTFRDQDYLNLYDLHTPGAPQFRESGIFLLRSSAFSPAYPWSLVFLANRIDTGTGARTFLSFEQEYWLPGRYIVGGRPDYKAPAPMWMKIWRDRALEIAIFVIVLAAAGVLYALRDRLVRRSTRNNKRWVSWPKYALWTISIGFFGFYLMAQPSITQVLTWFNAILFEWRWSLFLSDPFIFLFWCFIILTVFFWGRGMFCGWLCPYGALSEGVFRIAGALGLQRFQFKLPQRLHDRLKWIKYLVFAGLLVVSFYSIGMAEKLAEIEPFKTTFLVGVWNRSWPFVVFWAVLLILALFIERPFCKYLCPLGAGLAVPSTFRWWALKRKPECTTCHACAAGCDSLAIDTRGRIDPRECLLCLDCMVMYYDDHACPPLAKERKQRTKAGIALTPIGADGYYIPIHPLTTTPLRPVEAKLGPLAWLRRELVDHLFPWNRQFLTYPLALRAAGIALAILVTWAWLLGATGRLGPGLVLGWWFAWSVYELIVRMRCKPWVKEGPWWGHTMRPATWADMAAYVSMKNLLIGAALFLLMRGTGVLDFLHDLVELQWLY
ncbi:FMN-binding protein [Steroidobacter denitrificans]|uniref:FMN-binding protein n=1 Tax=Steroidobacter denitrificans TaxID=465721 RepID=A0A127FDS4_STEDE|nr:4Fe-4S binding protein [Steroidobacter denitrificans]AMN47779.1 FMN-binding protein [Steroidobacter denitrificans]